MARKLYTLKSSLNDDSRGDELLIERTSYVRKQFNFPANMGPTDIVMVDTNDFELSCKHMLDEQSYTHDEYDKREINALIDQFKEDSITAIAQSVSSIGNSVFPVTEIDDGLVFNVISTESK